MRSWNIRQVIALPIYGKVYGRACKSLRVKRSTELAILTIELPLYLPLAGLKGLLGLILGGNEGRYHHRVRAHVVALAANLYARARRGVSVSDEVAEVINRLPLRQAIPRLELIILKTLRVAYLMTAKALAGE